MAAVSQTPTKLYLIWIMHTDQVSPLIQYDREQHYIPEPEALGQW